MAPKTSGISSTIRIRYGNSSPVANAVQTTASAAGWPESRLISSSTVRATSSEASSGCRSRCRITRSLRLSNRLVPVSSTRLTPPTREAELVRNAAGAARARKTSRPVNTHRTR